MQKVTVSQKASDRKRNRRMPKKRRFLTPRRISSNFSCYRLDWKSLFLSAGGGKSRCPLSLEISSTLGFLLVATTANIPFWTQVEPLTCNCRKWFYNILHTPCLGNVTTFTGSGKRLHHIIVVKPQIKFESKGILVSFLLSLILFQLPQT